MKITRTLVAALFVVFAAVACSSSPMAPDSGEVYQSPMLGSGVGT